MIYEKEKTREISFPLGGIGAGCIGLAGNGRLIDWEIFNSPNKGSLNGRSHFAVRTEENGKVIDARILHGDLQAPYTGEMGTVKGAYAGFGWGPHGDNLCGLPHFRHHRFIGEFPVAEIEFNDDDFPGKAKLKAWSPFIPGDDHTSSAPIACFEIEIANNTKRTLDYTIAGVLGNPFNTKTSFNYYQKHDDIHHLTVCDGDDTEKLEYGDLTLSTTEPTISYQEYWHRGAWVDDLEVYWHDLSSPGIFPKRAYPRQDTKRSRQDTGTLASHFQLKPGDSRQIHFILSWNVPNRTNHWNPKADEMAKENGLNNRWKNWYATQWKDSLQSARHAIANYARIRSETFRFKDSLFNSTLPETILDGVSANLAILKSPTCLRLEDGTFYGWEGVGVSWGSCEGSCTHVWNYAQALPFLFPALERSMRMANYRYNVDENGGSHFRTMLPLGVKAKLDFMRPCVDGQFGDIMKTYRDWKISGDTKWLRDLWPTIQKTIEYAWSDNNYDRWDPDKSGVITGRQHHTLDMELFGPNAWLNGHYLGALKAASEMAKGMGDERFSATCQAIFDKGKTWMDENLFNGEYYYQDVDLSDKSLLEKFSRNGEDFAVDKYWNEEHREMKYQIGEGCAIDMHLPQWYASLYGIGEVLDPDKTKKTLEAIYHHNFKSTMRNVANTWRNYCLNDESGIQICSWPENKRKPVIPIPYASETMHGFEWAAACHMLMKGMRQEALTIVKSIRDRYDGERRNPWNEIECGSNYARSMASYAFLNAYCGFRFDRARDMIGFAPLETKEAFQCFWSLGDVWGEYQKAGNHQIITIRYGSIDLKEIEMNGDIKKIEIDEKELAFTSKAEKYVLNEKITLSTMERITLVG